MDRLALLTQAEHEVSLGLQEKALRRIEQTETVAAKLQCHGQDLGWLTRRLTSVRESVNGEAWELMLVSRQKIAVKIAPFFRASALERRDATTDPWRELDLLERCTALFKETGLPQLPLLFGYGICERLTESDYQNTRLQDRLAREQTGKALLLYNELCQCDLSSWVRAGLVEMEDREAALMSALFQILASLHVLQTRLGMVHFDLIPSNVLLASVESGYWQYQLGDQVWSVPNHGLAFIPWDFSRGVLVGRDAPTLVVRRTLSFCERSLKTSLPDLEERLLDQPDLALLNTVDVSKISRNLRKVLVNYGPEKASIRAMLSLLARIRDQALSDFVALEKRPQMTPKKLLRLSFDCYLGTPPAGARVLNEVPFVLG